MPKKKPSFFEKLTGTIKLDDYDPDAVEFQDEEETEEPKTDHSIKLDDTGNLQNGKDNLADKRQDREPEEEPSFEGELTVDVYETSDDIIVKTMVAGSDTESLDISIGREAVDIRGERHQEDIIDEGTFHLQELYWGAFSRTIKLPAEVEPEEAEATEKHGLLTIRLPKVNKDKKTKLKVKSG